ncbi:MAG TPA: peptidylprolyl isomerase [Dehalococcoidia bacterium]|nr:peptidylprolyl isomerase [Dehalococcoidia bacterium]
MPNKQPKRIKRKGRKPRGIADWSGPAARHGPFGLFSNVKLFYIIGIVIMVGGIALGGGGARFCGNSSSGNVTPTPAPVLTETPTPAPGEITPTPTVEQVKQWDAPPAMSIDPAKSYAAKITTSKGVIEAQLFAADAPNTVNNFVFLAQQDFFKNLPFYYVNPDYAATGDPSLDPSNTTKGGPGYELPNEPNSRAFEVGTLGMFEGSADGVRAGSRFFIVLNPSRLDSTNFWPFGEVKSGLDVLQALVEGDTVVGVEIQVQ